MGNSAKLLWVLTALELEAHQARRALKGLPAAVFCVGPAAAQLEKLSGKPDLIVITGLAGGLDPALPIASLVAQAGGIRAADQRANEPDLDLTALASAGILRLGTLITVRETLCQPGEKAEFWRRTGALAVEMEQTPIATWAEARGIAWLSLRAISDTAGDALPPAIGSWVDARGRTSVAGVLKSLLRQPSLAKTLWRLQRHSHQALGALGPVLRELVERKLRVS